ncbi:MAG: hypothetical protein LBD46_05305 [Endomicrobium sp.]|jgi:hypothetical protein|nr:hypothetical protein [Endomicrobium sp.]
MQELLKQVQEIFPKAEMLTDDCILLEDSLYFRYNAVKDEYYIATTDKKRSYGAEKIKRVLELPLRQKEQVNAKNND